MALSPSVPIAVPVITIALLYIVIDVGPLQHLREIQRHPIQHGSSLGICVDVFVFASSNGRGTRHQLNEHENK
jgi:hypothetical protein